MDQDLPLDSMPVCEDGDCDHRQVCSIHITADEVRRNGIGHPALTILPHAPPNAWMGSSGPCVACSRHVFQYDLVRSEKAGG